MINFEFFQTGEFAFINYVPEFNVKCLDLGLDLQRILRFFIITIGSESLILIVQMEALRDRPPRRHIVHSNMAMNKVCATGTPILLLS